MRVRVTAAGGVRVGAPMTLELTREQFRARRMHLQSGPAAGLYRLRPTGAVEFKPGETFGLPGPVPADLEGRVEIVPEVPPTPRAPAVPEDLPIAKISGTKVEDEVRPRGGFLARLFGRFR